MIYTYVQVKFRNKKAFQQELRIYTHLAESFKCQKPYDKAIFLTFRKKR